MNDMSFPTPTQFPSVKTLSQRAVLVRLKTSAWNPYAYDQTTTQVVNANAGTSKAVRVNKQLMKDSVAFKAVMAANRAPYTYCQEHTAPWALGGVSLLNIEQMVDFSQEMRARIDEARRIVLDYAANHYAADVVHDMQRLKQFADPRDYPADIAAEFGHAIQFLPVPEVDDFHRCGGLDEADAQSLTVFLREAEDNAAKHVIREMVAPLQYAAARLKEYTGAKGQRFHESVLTNILDTAERMAKVNLSDDPVVLAAIEDVRKLGLAVSLNPSSVKDDAYTRDAVQKKVAALVDQFAGVV